MVIQRAGDLRAQQHADPVGEHHNHALRLAFYLLARHAVGVDKANDKEKVIAHAVQQNAQIEQEAPLLADSESEKGVADEPRRHADEQHVFHPEATEQQRDHQHKDDL